MRNNATTVTAYIAIGSNLGDRHANVRKALAMLVETSGLEVRKISSMMENPAHGGPDDAPDFINAVAEVTTSLPPTALMKCLLEIESQMGRVRRTKWEARIIDLDLVLYGHSIMSTNDLMVPHPMMHERMFVLKPLAEIAPSAVHPTMNATAAQLLEQLRKQGAQTA